MHLLSTQAQANYLKRRSHKKEDDEKDSSKQKEPSKEKEKVAQKKSFVSLFYFKIQTKKKELMRFFFIILSCVFLS